MMLSQAGNLPPAYEPHRQCRKKSIDKDITEISGGGGQS